MKFLRGQSVYIESNRVLSVRGKYSPQLNRELLLDANHKEGVQILCDYLCRVLDIPKIKIYVRDQPRPLRGNCEVEGLFIKDGDKCSIRIYNLTARTKNVISIKSFQDTFIHEFIHYYDTAVLNIDTMHTIGFYKRISNLKEKLK